MKIEAKQDLENLIKDKIEESSELEYKSAGALEKTDEKKSEIAKDVSAMANSNGGLLIYGIKELNHVPQRITPIDRNKFSKEWLEQVINSSISPKIDNLKIIPISLDNSDNVAYVVEIPQGNTAHQNIRDCRYYRRHNFEALMMQDYEIRDIMNRSKHPIIELSFEINIVEEECVIESKKMLTSSLINYEKEMRESCYLVVKPYNSGKSYAQFVNYFIELPKSLLRDYKHLKNISSDCVEYFAENTFRDVVEIEAGLLGEVPKYGPSRFDPILPGLFGRSEKILLSYSVDDFLSRNDYEIKWRVHADNAPVKIGSTFLNKISVKKQC